MNYLRLPSVRPNVMPENDWKKSPCLPLNLPLVWSAEGLSEPTGKQHFSLFRWPPKVRHLPPTASTHLNKRLVSFHIPYECQTHCFFSLSPVCRQLNGFHLCPLLGVGVIIEPRSSLRIYSRAGIWVLRRGYLWVNTHWYAQNGQRN